MCAAMHVTMCLEVHVTMYAVMHVTMCSEVNVTMYAVMHVSIVIHNMVGSQNTAATTHELVFLAIMYVYIYIYIYEPNGWISFHAYICCLSTILTDMCQ